MQYMLFYFNNHMTYRDTFRLKITHLHVAIGKTKLWDILSKPKAETEAVLETEPWSKT